jgi:hypothetical protein
MRCVKGSPFKGLSAVRNYFSNFQAALCTIIIAILVTADIRRWSFVIREKYGHSPYLHQRERWWTAVKDGGFLS